MTTDKVKRKLTAILSADVKGYSRLMGADEVGTIRVLQTYRGVMSDLIQKKGGRVVDSPGDNVLAEFASVVDALESAVEIQKELKIRNADRSESRRMEFRIGINLGDVVEEGERIYGDGVNIAARIEGLAEGGGICISGTAFDQIGKRLPLGYEFMGEQEVKNIEKPVRVYRVLMEPEQAGKVIGEKGPKRTQWRWAVAAAVVLVVGALALWNFYFRPPLIEPASKEKMAFPLPDKPSIAVMPFLNMTADSKQDFFADGLSEGIITALAKVPQIFVIGRDSTFSYKGKAVKAKQVSEELGVQYVLEGSVQKAGDKARITSQLIDALKGYHLWAERYDRELKDVFAVQDEVTMKIITALDVKLTRGEWGHIASKGTENLDAYLKSQEAASCADQSTRESLERGRRLSEEAIALDPKFPHPYHVLGILHMIEALSGFSKNPRESLELANKMQVKAIELDESFAVARAVMGFNLLMLRKYDEAIAEAERAYRQAPGSSSVLYWYGTVLTNYGRSQEAVLILREVLRLEPMPMNSRLRSLSAALRDSGQYNEAIECIKKAIQREPDSMVSQLILTSTYAYAGREEEARAAAKEILRINPKFSIEQFVRASPQRDANARDRFAQALRKAGLPEKPPLPLPDKPSIAVLPFVNMSEDKSQEYFSDGLTEEIITALSKTPKLFVIARNSSFVYKDKPVNVQQVSRELGVKYVLEGSVRRSGNQLRITAQLIDATTGNHLWAERYDREMKDIFAIQDEITMKIVKSFIQLTEAEMWHMSGRHPTNLQAYLKLLEGAGYSNQSKFSDALKSFEEALSLDPHFPPTYGWIAWMHMFNVWFGPSATRGQSLEKAFQFAEKAKALDDKAWGGPAALGHAYLLKRDYEKAISEGKLATELSPNSSMAASHLGWTLRSVRRYEEAIKEYERALRLDPLNYYTATQIGTTYLMMGRFEESISTCKKALEGNFRNLAAHLTLAMAYSSSDKMDEARAAASDVLKISPNFSVEHFATALPFKYEEDRVFMADALRKAGLK